MDASGVWRVHDGSRVEPCSPATGRPIVVDGEILVRAAEGRYDFATLMARLHPAAARVALLSARSPATFVLIDALTVGRRDLRGEPFSERRAALETLVRDGDDRVQLTAATTDPEIAAGWLRADAGASPGVDGVMAKPRDLTYRAGERAMLKVKLERTLDCVVAGFRLLADRPLPSSLLLGLYDEARSLQHIGIAGSFSARLRTELVEVLGPLTMPLAGHPWERGFLLEGGPVGRLKGAAGRWAPGEMSLDWIPVEPSRVAEVSYDHIEHRRLRHPARDDRAMPLAWAEVERSAAELYVGPAEALERIERLGDLIAPALSVVQTLPGAAARD